MTKLRYLLAAPLIAILFAPTLPAADFFDGVDQPSAPVMEQARQRIESMRKGDFRVTVLDSAGKPYTGRVSVRLTRHEFRFGASAYGIPRLPEARRKQVLDVMAELFNTITVTNYWPENQPTRAGERSWSDADWMVQWATGHGITMRFHSMFFPSVKWLGEVSSTDEWWRIVEARIRAIAERYGSRIHEYDVLNEVASSAWIWSKDKDTTRDFAMFPHFSEAANGARCFQLARKYLPDAELVCNDQTIATPAGKDLNVHLKYVADLLAAGAPVDVFGQQAHFYASGQKPFQEGHTSAGPGAFTMAMLDKGFDRMGASGKPVHITEFSPPSRSNKRTNPQPRLSDEEVAAWQVNYYTLAFSKPFVAEITRWFVVDELGGRGVDAGVITKDGQLKPAYYALRKLLKETWSTVLEIPVQNGSGSFRGFYGDYEIRAANGTKATFQAKSKSGGVPRIRLL